MEITTLNNKLKTLGKLVKYSEINPKIRFISIGIQDGLMVLETTDGINRLMMTGETTFDDMETIYIDGKAFIDLMKKIKGEYTIKREETLIIENNGNVFDFPIMPATINRDDSTYHEVLKLRNEDIINIEKLKYALKDIRLYEDLQYYFIKDDSIYTTNNVKVMKYSLTDVAMSPISLPMPTMDIITSSGEEVRIFMSEDKVQIICDEYHLYLPNICSKVDVSNLNNILTIEDTKELDVNELLEGAKLIGDFTTNDVLNMTFNQDNIVLTTTNKDKTKVTIDGSFGFEGQEVLINCKYLIDVLGTFNGSINIRPTELGLFVNDKHVQSLITKVVI